VEKFKIEEEIKMTNKTLLFTLAISGLIGMGETANADTSVPSVTFRCPVIDDGFTTLSHTQEKKQLRLGVSYYQRISPSRAIDWSALKFFRNIHWENPEKRFIIKTIYLKGAALGYDGSPFCDYELVLSGITFQNKGTSIELSLEPAAHDLHKCTLESGTTFTCRER
jgi:hypothetical protein